MAPPESRRLASLHVPLRSGRGQGSAGELERGGGRVMGGWEWHPRMRLAACQEKSVGILAAGPTVGRHLITRLSALLLDAPGLAVAGTLVAFLLPLSWAWPVQNGLAPNNTRRESKRSTLTSTAESSTCALPSRHRRGLRRVIPATLGPTTIGHQSLEEQPSAA